MQSKQKTLELQNLMALYDIQQKMLSMPNT